MQKILVRNSIFLFLFLMVTQDVVSHPVWTQRNEPGSWTIVLYHFDEEEVNDGQRLDNAEGNAALDLWIDAPAPDSLVSTLNVAREVLLRAAQVNEPVLLVSSGTVVHPTGDLSIEIWLKMENFGVDIRLGLFEGASLHIRSSVDGDRFQLLGLNAQDAETNRFGAPGFTSFPPVTRWNHYGVTIHAPKVERTAEGNYRYGGGCYAKFFYDSHIVGFVGNQQVDLEGLEFSPQSRAYVHVYEPAVTLDEMMVSRIDWTDPSGHEGIGHGGIRVDHSFENGRQPVSIRDWAIY